MGITLITIIGRGNIRNDSYEKTRYLFPDGSQSGETTIFSKALIERYKESLESVVIAGTETSSWSALLPDDSDNEKLTEFLLKLLEQEKRKQAISPLDLDRVSYWMHTLYGSEVHILPPQKSNISEEENAFSVYSNVFSYVSKGSKIVFDITSGFRYMPLLIFQNLQLHSQEISIDDVEMVYAELNSGKAVVRNISSVWKAAEINKELHSFKSSFDGHSLGKTVKAYGYPKIAAWIEEFTDNIQKNFVMTCDRDFFARLKNLLEREIGDDLDSISSSFIRETALFLKTEIVDWFDFKEKRLSYYLFTLSYILNRRNLFTQAIIALRESLYTRIFENHDPGQIGQYISEKDLRGRAYYIDFTGNVYRNTVYGNAIQELRDLRNSIAHAGADKNKKQHLSQDFSYYYKAVSEVFSRVEK